MTAGGTAGATKGPTSGRLIALEGTGGRGMSVAARRLERSFRPARAAAGVSGWDASGIFFEIAQGARGIPAPPAQTLVLLYAADLAFRLRWEIRPALAAGRTVVAAPYVDTAVAFGRAAGVPAGWLTNLFRFAPPAAERHFVTAERGAACDDGFVGLASQRVHGVDRRARRKLIGGAAAHLRAEAKRRARRTKR